MADQRPGTLLVLRLLTEHPGVGELRAGRLALGRDGGDAPLEVLDAERVITHLPAGVQGQRHLAGLERVARDAQRARVGGGGDDLLTVDEILARLVTPDR